MKAVSLGIIISTIIITSFSKTNPTSIPKGISAYVDDSLEEFNIDSYAVLQTDIYPAIDTIYDWTNKKQILNSPPRHSLIIKGFTHGRYNENNYSTDEIITSIGLHNGNIKKGTYPHIAKDTGSGVKYIYHGDSYFMSGDPDSSTVTITFIDSNEVQGTFSAKVYYNDFAPADTMYFKFSPPIHLNIPKQTHIIKGVFNLPLTLKTIRHRVSIHEPHD